MNYGHIISRTVNEIKPSGIRRFFDIAVTMENVVTLAIGEPDFVTPWHIRDAGMTSLEKGYTWYTGNSGLKELREEICVYLDRRFEMKYEFAETLVTVGGSEAIDAAFRALLNPGDEALIIEPSFVCYAPMAALAGGTPVMLKTHVRDNFRLTAETLKKSITPKTKLLLISFPNNPTGAIMEKSDLEAIAEVIRGTDIVVISDEIYAELTYGKKHVSIASLPGMRDRTLVVSGFSKAYAMTGWRLGYAAGPKWIIDPMTKIHQYAIMCAPTMSQFAGVEALKNGDDDIQMMCEEYDSRRKFLVKSLNKIGLSCFEPEGAFYVFPSIKSTGMTSEEFCTGLLEKKRVATVPGTAFGDSGEGYVRCCYAQSVENIEKALERIDEFIHER